VFRELVLGIVRGNSIEMTDVRMKIDFQWDDETDDLKVDIVFTESNIGATTFVMKPAFADAKGVLEEEVTAAFAIEGDLEVTAAFEVVIPEPEEIEAATRILAPHEAFTVPEPDSYQTWKVSRDGRFVSGHLGTWDTCHTGLAGRCTRIPRSPNGYRSYCKTPLATDKGTAYTGPVILLGGHDATRDAINKAMANVENAWADIVVVDGKFGPWGCGVVRPGVTDEALYAGGASRISGHWLNGDLFALCSVSAEGFDVPRATEFVVELDDTGEVEYLAASFAFDCGCEDTEDLGEADYDAAIAAAVAALEVDDACEAPVPA
jgi:hypothetical protein